MVDQRVDEARLPVKVHMEEMRRVEVQNTTYYYNPISETPFSLALAFAGEQGGNLVTGGAATGHWPEVGGIEEVHGEAHLYVSHSITSPSFRTPRQQPVGSPPRLDLLQLQLCSSQVRVGGGEPAPLPGEDGAARETGGDLGGCPGASAGAGSPRSGPPLPLLRPPAG